MRAPLPRARRPALLPRTYPLTTPHKNITTRPGPRHFLSPARLAAEDDKVPLSTIKIAVLSKVVEFLNHHVDKKLPEIEKPLKSANLAELTPALEPWDIAFVDCDQEMLFELILAANFMDIKPLLDLACAKVASMIKGKTPEDIRKTFNIKNDFTPEEEAAIKEENKWVEEV